MRESIEAVFLILFFILIFPIPIIPIAGIVYSCEYISCKSKASQMQAPFKYGAMSGCMINKKSQWIPIENYRITE